MTDGLLGPRLDAALGPGHPVVAAAVVAEGGASLRTAVRGAAADADLEVGSVSKALTGLLYVDALGRGEVASTTTLADLLPLGEVPAGRVTLEELATHTSGLPRLPAGMHPWRRSVDLWLRGANPYGDTVEQLLEQTRGVRLRRRGRRHARTGTVVHRPAYSNLGFELLGHALASAAGTSYAELLRRRLAEPLGMDSSYVPTSQAQLRPTAVVGRTRLGRPCEPWTGEAIGPAGGVRSTAPDLARLVAALLDGSAPGVGALEPRVRFGPGARIGAAWLTVAVRGREITWHNGRTGGFASWIGLDRAAGRGAVLLSATSRPVDRAGFALLHDGSSPR